uniref:Uncharacterized protein LOC100369482 n=1 Tax=Saccoglossus kowalevskii TaxID=10224 RepID=A0ABM0MI79_SACKO|nr:PREDICTED: uncharacterized protein LOC100369482 [Saccoglossus kowalevskii]
MACSITSTMAQHNASRIFLICILFILSHNTFVNSTFNVDYTGSTLTVSIGNIELIHHTEDSPFLYTGNAEADIDELHGNFKIDEYLIERIALTDFVVHSEIPEYIVSFSRNGEYATNVTFSNENNVVRFMQTPPGINRYWVRFVAEDDEHVYGGGEQFSYFDLRGNEFPLWTREQGVGRNKSTITTFNADNTDGGGGDYHTTYFPQPTFVSSRKYYCHFSTTVYSVLNFIPRDFHEVEIWSAEPGEIYFDIADTMLELVQKLGGFLGRQPELPEWIYRGATLGVQGGTDAMLAYVDQAKEYDIELSAMWIQDWAGRITTSFGSRIFWNWKWNEEHYPNLREEIQNLKNEGIGVLTYVNPYLNIEGDLFKEGDALGYFVKNTAGDTYVADFGEFFCGTLDFTNPDAYEWYKNEIIIKNMIELGLSGWMADFGEYLPVKDVVLHSGESAEVMHNAWPALWAKMNREAVEESGKLGEIVYWMRAGYTGSQQYSTIMWAGDQFVDFSRSDGLPSTIPAALSMSMIGCGMTHFDIGGYTALYGYSRSEELLLRSAEMAVFTPMMRTHEGNRPKENWHIRERQQ